MTYRRGLVRPSLGRTIQTAAAVPYVFFMPVSIIPNRDLTLMYPFSATNPLRSPSMSDILYLAIGLGTFVLLALYARNLGRI